LQLVYKTKKLEKECTNYKSAVKSYGDISAKKLHQRVKELMAASSLEEMVKFRIGRCHPLTGNLKGKFALDLQHPYRLIIEPTYNEDGQEDGIELVKLLEAKDYHEN